MLFFFLRSCISLLPLYFQIQRVTSAEQRCHRHSRGISPWSRSSWDFHDWAGLLLKGCRFDPHPDTCCSCQNLIQCTCAFTEQRCGSANKHKNYMEPHRLSWGWCGFYYCFIIASKNTKEVPFSCWMKSSCKEQEAHLASIPKKWINCKMTIVKKERKVISIPTLVLTLMCKTL